MGLLSRSLGASIRFFGSARQSRWIQHPLPLYVRGTITGRPTGRVSLAISVNGVIVATTVSYLEQGERVFASMIPEEALVSGSNEVQVFVLDGVSDDSVLGSAWIQDSGA